MLQHLLKITLRNIKGSKLYTLINVIGLSLGLTSIILIILWVKYEMSFDKFHKYPRDLFKAAFCYEPQDFHGYILPAPVAQQLKQNYPDVENATVFIKQQNRKIVYEQNAFFANGSYVDSTFFSLFNFPFAIGSPSEAFIHPNAIIITQNLANRLFGDRNPIGNLVKLDDNQKFIVSGVLKNIPSNSDIQFDFLVPYKLVFRYLNNWDLKTSEVYVRLRHGKSYAAFNKQIANVISQFKPEWNNRLYLTPLIRCHLYNLKEGGRIQYVYIFSLIAFLIFIIATFNFINITIAKSETRIKEIGIKRIIGGRKRLLITQLLFEAQCLALAALAFSIVLTELLLPILNNILHLNLNLVFNFSAIFVLLGFSFLTGLISGIYPALYISSVKPIDIIKRNIRALSFSYGQGVQSNSVQKITLQRGLVVFQFAMAIVLIIGIIVIRQQLKYIQGEDLGFDKKNVLVVHLQGDLLKNYETVKNQLLQVPDILSVATSGNPLTGWQASCSPEWEGKQSDNIFDMGVNFVDYDFDKTLGITILSGRFFSKEYPTDAAEGFVINEAAVKAMQLKEPVGTNMSIFEGTPYARSGKIIGIVKNMNTESLHSELRPFVFAYIPEGSYMYIKTGSSSITATVQKIRDAIKRIIPDDPVTLSFLDEDLNKLYSSEQVTEKIMEYSSFMAIIIACLGLFGLSFYGSQKRIKEIGIRKVSGARISEILTMLNKEFVKWVAVAFLFACPVAWYAMHRWLDNFAYRTGLRWWIFALAGVLTMGIALLTVSWQSWRAATKNPVEVLRYE